MKKLREQRLRTIISELKARMEIMDMQHTDTMIERDNRHIKNVKLAKARELWSQLGDTTTDEDGNIDVPFLDFPEGTDREDIWAWFEIEFDVSVAEDLMYTSSNKA